MLLQMNLLFEALGTNVTLERLLILVKVEMFLQMSGLIEVRL